MKKKRRRRSPPKVSRYRKVMGRLSHSMVALAVVTVGLTFGLASVGWAVNGKPLLAGNTNTATQPTVLDKAGAGPALDLRVGSGPALAVNTTNLVTNLNADQLDGMGADSFATQSALNDERAAREAADTTLQNNINAETRARSNADNQLRSDLKDPGTINQPSNPVDWTKLKGVPAGFADGEDAAGSSGELNATVKAGRSEVVKPPQGSTAANAEVVFETAAFEILGACTQVEAFFVPPSPPGQPPPGPQLVSVPVGKLYVVAKEPNVLVRVKPDGSDTHSYRFLGTGEKAMFADGAYGTYFVDAPSGFLEGDGMVIDRFVIDPATGTPIAVRDTCRFSVNGLGKEVSP
jgi:hypothetical protein